MSRGKEQEHIFLRQPGDQTISIGNSAANAQTITGFSQDEINFIKHHFGVGIISTKDALKNLSKERQKEILESFEIALNKKRVELKQLTCATIGISKFSVLGAQIALNLAKNGINFFLTHDSSIVNADETARWIFEKTDLGTNRIEAMNRVFLANRLTASAITEAKECSFFLNIFNLNAVSTLSENLDRLEIPNLTIMTLEDKVLISPVFKRGLGFCNSCFCGQFSPESTGKAWTNQLLLSQTLLDCTSAIVTAKIINHLIKVEDPDDDCAVLVDNSGSVVRYCKTQTNSNCECSKNPSSQKTAMDKSLSNEEV